jgi:ribosomal protein S18 acetylase RimI-like enzyme
MPEPILRQATAADLPACGEVYAAAFARPPYNEDWPLEDATELLQTLWRKEPDLCFCLEYEGQPVGFAFCSTVGRFRAVIEEFALHPGFQGIGWGRLLLDHCLSVFRQRGYPRAELIANAQAPAYEFYRRMGFRQAHRYVLMLKDL